MITFLYYQIRQTAEDNTNGDPLYSGTIQLRLRISPQVIIGSNTHIHESIGVISGIILAIIFIILIFILLSIFLTKRRKSNKKYSTLTDKSSEELLKPIWVPGMLNLVTSSLTSPGNKTPKYCGSFPFSVAFLSVWVTQLISNAAFESQLWSSLAFR